MGSKTTKTTSSETATTTPNVPGYASAPIANFYGNVGNYGASDPYQYVTKANSLQNTAFGRAAGLLGNPDAFNTAMTSARGAMTATAPMADYRGMQMGSLGNAAQAGPVNLGSEIERVTGQSALTNLNDYLNPATANLVDTTLASFDDNSARTRAANAAAAAKGGAFGGSRYAIQQAATDRDLAMARAGTEANLRNTAWNNALAGSQFDTANRQSAMLANAAAANARAEQIAALNAQNSQFNAGQQNQFALANFGAQNDANQFNAGAFNQNQQFNAGQEAARQARALEAAGLLGSLAAQQSGDERANLDAQMQAGNALWNLENQYTQAPLTQLQNVSGLFNPALLNQVTGQTVTSNANSETKQPSGLLNSVIGGIAKAAATAAMASDIRVKRDIVKLGEEPDGLGVYRYNYIWDDEAEPARIGVMAQEVEQLRPWALGPTVDGVMSVDYSKLGAN